MDDAVEAFKPMGAALSTCGRQRTMVAVSMQT